MHRICIECQGEFFSREVGVPPQPNDNCFAAVEIYHGNFWDLKVIDVSPPDGSGWVTTHFLCDKAGLLQQLSSEEARDFFWEKDMHHMHSEEL